MEHLLSVEEIDDEIPVEELGGGGGDMFIVLTESPRKNGIPPKDI